MNDRELLAIVTEMEEIFIDLARTMTALEDHIEDTPPQSPKLFLHKCA